MQLKIALMDSKAEELSAFSLSHILVPLAMHHISGDDFQKKDAQIVSQEAILFLGGLCLSLPWSPYYTLLRTVLKLLRKKSDKERTYLNALCSILESFHFELGAMVAVDYENIDGKSKVEMEIALTGAEDVIDADINANLGAEDDAEDDAEDNAEDDTTESNFRANGVTKTLLNAIYPRVRSFLVKEELDSKGHKSKVIRPQIAVALTNLLRKLEPPLIDAGTRRAMLSNLIMSIVNTLKSRDSDCRDLAREGLVKIVKSLGLGHLQIVLYELTQGLQVHFLLD